MKSRLSLLLILSMLLSTSYAGEDGVSEGINPVLHSEVIVIPGDMLVERISGEAYLRKKDFPGFNRIEIGDVVSVGDRISASAGALIQLVFNDNSINLRAGKSSQWYIFESP